MKVGVPKELKDNENRVGLTPEGAAALAAAGHDVLIERNAGLGCGIENRDYQAAGARLCSADEAWATELVIKVKEPLESEYRYFGGQIVFAYFHLSGLDRALTAALLRSGTTALAYETVEDENGRFPLLAPMSAIAGSMAPLMGSYYLAKSNGGRGTLIGELLGQRHGKVVILGDGVVGRNACRVASALGGRVFIFGLFPERAAELERLYAGVQYVLSTPENLARHLQDADLLVGAVLRPGARAPHVVTEAMVKSMPEGSVIVDVSIDQGGCVATSRPTSHSDPVFIAHGVIHYCVTNMPGAYPRTSTFALTGATLPYVSRIANGGIAAVLADPGFAKGVNTHKGHIAYEAVAAALGL
ncbi:MAG TPA: alanine dehydrogenase, partial [Gammaproteobacteria bacterium]|nr:alanine dehydrogenase [Gammaproteobacteria bacterium]